ncbi:MAG: GNAT family N-acetyltransferase [Thermotogaceae bacterium]|nr:GNAT family N-acetyltransferase [Thermotogaceae bacterium]
MIIRIAKKEELESILKLLYSCFAKTPKEYFLRFVPEREFPGNSVVAVDSGEIVGYVQVYTRYLRTSKDPVKVGGIGNVCTKKTMRGKGVASKLLSYATSYMKDIGYEASVLFASKHKFYVKNGWKLVMTYHYEFDVGGILKSSHEVINKPDDTLLKDLMKTSEEFNKDFAFTVVRDEYLWNFQLEYFLKKGSILIKSSTDETYVLFDKVNDGVYNLLDFAGNPSKILDLLPEDSKKILFFSKPCHPVTEYLAKNFPYTEKEHVLIFVKPIKTDEKSLDDLIFTKRWHYWAFDMF